MDRKADLHQDPLMQQHLLYQLLHPSCLLPKLPHEGSVQENLQQEDPSSHYYNYF